MTYYFYEHIVLELGDVAESFLERYRSFVNAVDVHIHARIRLPLMHQDNQALYRTIHRKAVHADVRGPASAGIQTLQYNWSIEVANDCNAEIRRIAIQGKSLDSPRFDSRSSMSTIFVFIFRYFMASRVSIKLLECFLLSLMLDIAITNSSSYNASCRLAVRAVVR